MIKEAKVGLVASDKRSYYQKWSNNSDFELHETTAI